MQPVASVDQQSAHQQQQRSGYRGRSCCSGGHDQPASRGARRGADDRSAPAPVRLTAGVGGPWHGHTLATVADMASQGGAQSCSHAIADPGALSSGALSREPPAVLPPPEARAGTDPRSGDVTAGRNRANAHRRDGSRTFEPRAGARPDAEGSGRCTSTPRRLARTKRVHQLSREGSSASLRFQVCPANWLLLGTAGNTQPPSHGGNPGSNPGSGTSRTPGLPGVSSFRTRSRAGRALTWARRAERMSAKLGG